MLKNSRCHDDFISLFERNLAKSFIFFKPKDVVSGDFYWIYKDQKKKQ